MDSLHAALPDPTIEATAQVNVNEILHEVLRLSTDTLLSNGIVVDWRPTAVLPTVEGRANALRGLFKYLIDNAIKFTTEGEIRVTVAPEPNASGDALMFEIRDTGPGIAQQDLKRVFQPLEQVNEDVSHKGGKVWALP